MGGIMKVSDYIVDYLETIGVTAAFAITGSVIADVLDSFLGHKKIHLYHPIHEQAAAMAAHAYTMVSGKIGVAITTSGPGATNLLTGLTCAWYDSVPVLFISGQVNSKFTKGNKAVRQVGFQETDVVGMVKCVTKYATMVTDPTMIRYELEKAVHYATTGRPGPVLLDIPVDVQRADINPSKLKRYSPETLAKTHITGILREKINVYISDLKKAKRPVVLVGGGIDHAGAGEEARELFKYLKVPAVLTWVGLDILPGSHPLNRGRIGAYGQRGANLTFQNADLLLSLGSRHDGRQTGGRLDSFAREAKRYIVDIDSGELKDQPIKGHVNINADLKEFIPLLTNAVKSAQVPIFTDWLKETKAWQLEFPTVLPAYQKLKNRVHSYYFMKKLSELMEEGDVIVGDCGGNIVPLGQAFEVKKNQRVVTSWSHSPMGYAFAAAIGAYFGKKKNTKHVVCTIGDGGMQVNIQELQTYKMYNIPVKVFVLNNESYGIIMQYQDTYLNSRYVGAAPKWGYTFPDFRKVAEVYGLKTELISTNGEVEKKVKKVLAAQGPVICEVKLEKKTILEPRLGWDAGIEDQYPNLDREVLKRHLYVKPFNPDKK